MTNEENNSPSQENAGALITAMAKDIEDRKDESKILIRDNMLIRAMYTGSISESKILLQALYDSQRTRQTVLTYSTEEIAECIGTSSGKSIYQVLHRAVKNMLRNTIIIHDSKKNYTEGFVMVPYCSYGHGVLTIELNQRIMPYLTDIKSTYTAMDIKKLQNFGGKKASRNFALRLYEILRTSQYILEGQDAPRYVTEYMTLEEMKLRTGLVREVESGLELMLEKHGMVQETLTKAGDMYPEWKDLKKRVLDPAVKEINETTHLHTEYEPKKVGSSGKIVGLTFRTRFTDGYVPKKKEKDSEDGNNLSSVQEIIKEPISDEDARVILDAADGDIEKVRKAYKAAEKQSESKKIWDLRKWMVSAIKGGWETDSKPVEKDDRTKKTADEGRIEKEHYKRYGFSPNQYDMDELEEELLNHM